VKIRQKPPIARKHERLQKALELMRGEKKLATDFFAQKKDAELFGLQALSYVFTGGSLLASGLPIIGNILNAANAIADTATLVERIRARAAGDPHATRADIAADLAGVAVDIAGIFFPPVQWPGQAAVASWDAAQTYIYHRDNFPQQGKP
jgi:hypothetical protein